MGDVIEVSNPMQDFQDKLKARVRDDIRDLMPEGAVEALVKKAIEDVFFTPRVTHEGGYNSRRVESPSWFIEAVTKAATPMIDEAVKRCVERNPAAVTKVIEDFIDSNRLAVATTKYLNGMLSDALLQVLGKMNQR